LAARRRHVQQRLCQAPAASRTRAHGRPRAARLARPSLPLHLLPAQTLDLDLNANSRSMLRRAPTWLRSSRSGCCPRLLSSKTRRCGEAGHPPRRPGAGLPPSAAGERVPGSERPHQRLWQRAARLEPPCSPFSLLPLRRRGPWGGLLGLPWQRSHPLACVPACSDVCFVLPPCALG
jgi:hypothetical protein